MILEPVLIECPHCHLMSSHYRGMSGTIYKSESFTDGKMNVLHGMISFDPVLVKCRQCTGFYLFDNAILEGDEDKINSYENYCDLSYEELQLSLTDYKKALQVLTELDPDLERNLRTTFWWKINDLIRYKSGMNRKESKFRWVLRFLYNLFYRARKYHNNYAEYKTWVSDKNENIQKLISLLEPEQYPDDQCSVVEIYRELGAFTEALQQLNKITDRDHKSFKKMQRKLIRRKNIFVYQLP